jgi:hypothetical protein
MLRYIPSIPSFFRAFVRLLNFVKGFFCISWDDQVIFVLDSVYGLLLVYWFMHVEPSLDSLEHNQFDHGLRSFKCVVEFSL